MRVGIVNDLKLAVMALRQLVERDPDSEVAWVAEDGVEAVARMDPLVPGLTDTVDTFCAVFPELERAGIRSAVATYLFLRWGIRPRGELEWTDWSFAEMRKLYTHKVTGYCGGGTVWLPPTDYRRERYATLKTMAEAHGVRVRLCRCKNPELTKECCHPQPKAPKAHTAGETASCM